MREKNFKRKTSSEVELNLMNGGVLGAGVRGFDLGT